MTPTTQEPIATETSAWQEIKVVLGQRNFRLLWLGEGISLLGDQFGFIALPWLVLQLTGDAFAMGVVMAMAGVPRAVFMLFGGAMTDRFSPRMLMLVTNIARMILVAALSLAILTNTIEMWMIYLFALLFGLADAFFYPASSAIVPAILPKQQLQIGNSITQGTAQLSVFLGPVLAGLIIAMFAVENTGSETAVPDLRGIGIAFALDAVTFLASALTLKLMRTTRPHTASKEAQNMWQSIREGLAYVWHDELLRTIFIIVAAISVLSIAPINLGVPVISDERMPNGAAAFGILMSAYGAGSLIGIILSGVLPRPPAAMLGTVLFMAVGIIGLLMMGLAFSYSLLSAGLLLALIGLIDGWVIIQFTTWLQLRSPEVLLGRIMALLMFAFVGLAPVADMVFGWLIEWNIVVVILVSGGLLAMLSFVAAFQPNIRKMGTAVSPRLD
ncbi:MAG: MFS transporter [Anaerolineae bacterium]|nr:MFS transporter [Anaerolineae bacterium]